ncbi:MAG: hypothetical protein AMXMBFR60_31550 [Chloroflexota bacterium]
MNKSIANIALNDGKKAATRHRFQTVWRTPAGVERVWETLAHYSAWATWWRGVRKVEALRRGDENGVGAVLRQGWRSWFPYTLVFDLEMILIEKKRLLEGRASGDLEGVCKWTFSPVNGGTEIRFDADVRTSRWWMNLPLPFAPQIIRASFETIMRWGREGLERKLGAPVELRI